MSKKVVVTGASGFLGHAVVAALRARNSNVLPVARSPVPGGIHLESYAHTPAGEVLIHLAEDNDRARVRASGPDYERVVQETLESLVGKGYKTIVYASSALLYGDAALTARKPTDGVYAVDAYTRVKRRSEETVLASGVGIAARLANVYGTGMAPSNVLNTILGQIPGSGPLFVMDDTPVRDFVSVEDAADALAAMALEPGAPGTYNVGSGQGISIGDLARLALQLAGQHTREVTATRRGEGASSLVLDISETTSAWNWLPKTNLREGLMDLLHRNKGQTKA